MALHQTYCDDINIVNKSSSSREINRNSCCYVKMGNN